MEISVHGCLQSINADIHWRCWSKNHAQDRQLPRDRFGCVVIHCCGTCTMYSGNVCVPIGFAYD